MLQWGPQQGKDPTANDSIGYSKALTWTEHQSIMITCQYLALPFLISNCQYHKYQHEHCDKLNTNALSLCHKGVECIWSQLFTEGLRGQAIEDVGASLWFQMTKWVMLLSFYEQKSYLFHQDTEQWYIGSPWWVLPGQKVRAPPWQLDSSWLHLLGPWWQHKQTQPIQRWDWNFAFLL